MKKKIKFYFLNLKNKMYSCRICFEESDVRNNFIVPCNCLGTGKYVHKECLNSWLKMGIKNQNYEKCNTCLTKYLRKTQNNEKQINQEFYTDITFMYIFITLIFILFCLFINKFPLLVYIVWFFVIEFFYIFLIVLYGPSGFIFFAFMILIYVFSEYKKSSKKGAISFTLFAYLFFLVFYSDDLNRFIKKDIVKKYRLSNVSEMYDFELKQYVKGVM